MHGGGEDVGSPGCIGVGDISAGCVNLELSVGMVELERTPVSPDPRTIELEPM